MTTRLILEPHGDDAFLSLGGHIENWVKAGDAVTIATAYADRKREGEAKAYASAVGAAHVCYGYAETGRPDAAPATSPGGSLDESLKDTLLKLHAVPLGSHGLTIKLYAPLGVRHEEHKAARSAAYNVTGELNRSRHGAVIRLYYYMDQPYASMAVNSTEVSDAMAGYLVSSYLKPTQHKYKHAPLFKSQSKFFHFNPPGILKHNPELILKGYE